MPITQQPTCPEAESDRREAAWTVVPDEESVKRTRDRVPAELRQWGLHLTDDREFEIRIIVSELVTNALRHAPRHDIRFAMWMHKPGQLVLEVQDRGSQVPSHVRPAATADDTTGRGMFLVEALALSWGVSYPEAGKSVHATIAVPAA